MRDIAQTPEGAAGPDVETLPESSNAYIAICIAGLPEGNPAGANYLAYWLAEEAKGAGIVAVWD